MGSKKRGKAGWAGTGVALGVVLVGGWLGGWMVSPSRAGIAGTRHDLSSSITPRVCEFCHTPHYANTTLDAPLWNRVVGNKVFTMYASPTMKSPPAAAPGSHSLICLGCHDGVLGNSSFGGFNVSDKHDLLNGPGSGGVPDLTSTPNCERCHPNLTHGGRAPFWLGTDLRNDHPISIDYPSPVVNPEFNPPTDPLNGWTVSDGRAVALYQGKVECGSCHNVHDATYPPFLRISNAGSAMCLTCHKK